MYPQAVFVACLLVCHVVGLTADRSRQEEPGVVFVGKKPHGLGEESAGPPSESNECRSSTVSFHAVDDPGSNLFGSGATFELVGAGPIPRELLLASCHCG